MTSSLLSIPIPSQTPISRRPYINSSSNNTWLHGPATLITYPSKLTIPLSSSSSPSSSSTSTSTSAVEDGPSPPPDSLPFQSESSTQVSVALPLRGCKACGREELERGCNGEGRIQGGIATIPGFGWWPIKAYRPCPGFVASGGRYRRRGQSMDEVAFGREERGASGGISSEVQASKKKKDPKRFKR